MSIHLNDSDRAKLRRIERGRIKSPRRQKAIALLRLAAGLSPTEVAQHAGIPKKQVETLATEFAVKGLAGVGLDGKRQTVVRLVRPGVDAEEYCLPNGATLADLLRRSKARTVNQVVYVDEVMAEETARLRDGAVILIVPRIKNAAVAEPWRATIPSFRDETLFRQYTEALKARHRDLDTDEDSKA